MSFLTTLLLSVLITIALTPAFSAVALRYRWVDLPNERKVHVIPTPRVGGVAMALAAFIPLCYWLPAEPFVLAYLAGGGLLVLLGGVDDFRDLSPKVKFAGQTSAALIAVFLGGVQIETLGGLAPDGFLLPGWFGIPLTVVVIVGVTNAINLSDGLDGLAGGLSLLIFAGIGYLAYLDANLAIGLISIALLGALFGFLRFNTHPASVFMGDAGSQFLGFSAITLCLALTQGHPTPLSPVLPLILLGFPVLDTLTVMVVRIGAGRSPFSADQNHFHHNLMALGFLHPESVFIIYVFQTFLLLASVYFRFYSDWGILAGYLVFSSLVVFGFTYASRNRRKVRRYDFLDTQISGRLRVLKRDGVLIRYSFLLFETGVPLLLFITCLVAEPGPYLRLAGLVCAAALLAVWRVRRAWLPGLLRVVLYLLIPFSVYLSGSRVALLGVTLPVRAYNASFGAIAVLIILISKFSRRVSGFRSTPMDFLIIILALVVPNLPAREIQEYQIGLVAAKILLLYFSFEILQAELRGKLYRTVLWTLASLAAMSW
jgi:UDP-GlcNAc:undecaprenyl-phosphate/decaprenyl-phosphate GlcNAc-1-phosphate transferase